MGRHALDCLPTSRALRDEIRHLVDRGYAVGHAPEAERTDLAYTEPARVHAMYHRLADASAEYGRRQRAEIAWRARVSSTVVSVARGTPARALLGPLHVAAARATQGRDHLRRELLYSQDKSAWHGQAGQATALLTIAYAHELSSERTSGRYPTMSGPLGEDVVDVTFDARGSEMLQGRTLREASVVARTHLQGRSPEEAERAADRRLRRLREFVGQPVSEDFKQIVQFCSDGIAIRTRKAKVREVITEHVTAALASGGDTRPLTILSVGCGTALPFFELAAGLRDAGVPVHLILLDQDPVALAAAQRLAELEEFRLGDAIELHCRRIFSTNGTALDLAPVIRGRAIDVVEDTGLREYLPPRVYRSLTSALWDALAPGGIMSTGNMIKNRPQPEFLHGLMGWEPTVRMRSVAEGFALHEASGVPRGATAAHVTADGVYALYASVKGAG